MTDKNKKPEIIDIRSGENISPDQSRALSKLIEQGIEITPQHVQSILDTPVATQAVVSLDDTKQLMFDYIVFQTKNNGLDLDDSTLPGVTYLVKLLVNFITIDQNLELKKAIDNPYYFHWASLGEFQKAGDVSVYNYLFFKRGSKKTNLIKWEDYINFAVTGYYNYFGNEKIAQGIGGILPGISGIAYEHDFFRRGLQGL